ncbi:unnamed protein product, partial [Effrenium voratum]
MQKATDPSSSSPSSIQFLYNFSVPGSIDARLQPLGAFRLYECRDGPLERRSLDLPKDRDEILDPGT